MRLRRLPAMRQFLHTHWKLIAILLAIVLALITAEIDSAPAAPPLTARLRAHVEATTATKPDVSGRYIETTLQSFGYAPVRARQTRDIEVAVANLAPGAKVGDVSWQAASAASGDPMTAAATAVVNSKRMGQG